MSSHRIHNFKGRAQWTSRTHVPPSTRYGQRWKSLPLEAETMGYHSPFAQFLARLLLVLTIGAVAYIALRVARSFL